MARVGVERQPRGAAHWWLFAALVIVTLLAIGLFSDWYGARTPEAALYDPGRPAPAMIYGSARWVPEGPPVAASPRDAVQVGESLEGHRVYVMRETALAGGGGGDGRLDRVFVRTTEGTYQPFVRQAE